MLTSTESFLKLLDFEYSESFLSFSRSITRKNRNVHLFPNEGFKPIFLKLFHLVIAQVPFEFEQMQEIMENKVKIC